MTEDEHIERHLEIAQRVFERLVAEGKIDQIKLPEKESSASPKVP